MNIHEKYMALALAEAKSGLGRVAPNPSVGCVIVKNDEIIAKARTSDTGRPHAETNALKIAGDKAKNATAYVTLEPCNHHGKTPPCVDALINAGISEIVIACTDPDPRTSGKSIEKIKNAGINVITNILKNEAEELNKGFFLTIKENRPLITIKCATSADGKIATSSGSSKWITNEQSRGHVHLERSKHDAILVGVGTVIADNPLLTTRIEGVNHIPVRIVMDKRLEIPLNSNLVKTRGQSPLWIIYSEKYALLDKVKALQMMGIKTIAADSLGITINCLAKNGITRLFVEGGTNIFTSFIQYGLYDRILWYRSSKIIGGDGKNIFKTLGIKNIEDAISLNRKDIKIFDNDILEVFSKGE